MNSYTTGQLVLVIPEHTTAIVIRQSQHYVWARFANDDTEYPYTYDEITPIHSS